MVRIDFSPAKMESIGILGILKQWTNKMSQEESVTMGQVGNECTKHSKYIKKMASTDWDFITW